MDAAVLCTGSALGHPSTTHRQRREPTLHACSHPGCGKVFNRKFNLRCHARIHSNEKPYLCHHKNCQRSFRWKSSLNHHLMSLDHATPASRLARKRGIQRRKMLLQMQSALYGNQTSLVPQYSGTPSHVAQVSPKCRSLVENYSKQQLGVPQAASIPRTRHKVSRSETQIRNEDFFFLSHYAPPSPASRQSLLQQPQQIDSRQVCDNVSYTTNDRRTFPSPFHSNGIEIMDQNCSYSHVGEGVMQSPQASGKNSGFACAAMNSELCTDKMIDCFEASGQQLPAPHEAASQSSSVTDSQGDLQSCLLVPVSVNDLHFRSFNHSAGKTIDATGFTQIFLSSQTPFVQVESDSAGGNCHHQTDIRNELMQYELAQTLQNASEFSGSQFASPSSDMTSVLPSGKSQHIQNRNISLHGEPQTDAFDCVGCSQRPCNPTATETFFIPGDHFERCPEYARTQLDVAPLTSMGILHQTQQPKMNQDLVTIHREMEEALLLEEPGPSLGVEKLL